MAVGHSVNYGKSVLAEVELGSRGAEERRGGGARERGSGGAEGRRGGGAGERRSRGAAGQVKEDVGRM